MPLFAIITAENKRLSHEERPRAKRHVFISSCGGQVYHFIRMSGVDGLARGHVHLFMEVNWDLRQDM